MRLAIFGFAWRPQVDAQNTGRAAYERPLGVGNVTVNGQGGFANFRSLSPFNLSSSNDPYIATAGISGAGSVNGLNTNPQLEPLIDRQNGNQGMSNAPQF